MSGGTSEDTRGRDRCLKERMPINHDAKATHWLKAFERLLKVM